MANSNPQAVNFSNTRVRPMADLLYSTYLSAKSIIAQWNSQSVSSVIPNDSTLIADGSDVDGRPPVSNLQATSIITRCMEFVTDYEANSSAKLNTVTAVEVNGRGQV